MNMPKYLLVFGTLLSLGIADLATAQQPPQKAAAQNISRKRDIDLETRIYKLKEADVYEAYETLKHIYNIRNVAMLEQSDSLVVRDTPAILDQIADLLEHMELQSKNDPSPRETAQVIRLDHRDPDSIADMLNAMFRETRIRADFDSRQIVLKGDNAAEIEEIVRMIAALDVQVDHAPKRDLGKTFSITVDFISATVGAKGGGELPENLQGVAAALRKQGLGGAKIFGHVMVRTQNNEKFESRGVVRSNSGAVSFISLSGTAELADGRAQLQITSRLELPITQAYEDKAGKARTKTSYEDFGMSTTTTVPLGDYLVLGAMPASTEDSDTILMVIHITAD